MLKVGLTGGIACGKSHTLKQFHKLGAVTIDADRIAHLVMQPGKPAYENIVQLFGPDILAPDKTIDRRRLAKLVFSDPDLRAKLNAAVHPHVYEAEHRGDRQGTPDQLQPHGSGRRRSYGGDRLL